MRKLLRDAVTFRALLAAPACAFQAAHPAPAYLSEDQIIDMMDHAARWNGRIVTVRIYPYDFGSSEPTMRLMSSVSKHAAGTSPRGAFSWYIPTQDDLADIEAIERSA